MHGRLISCVPPPSHFSLGWTFPFIISAVRKGAQVPWTLDSRLVGSSTLQSSSFVEDWSLGICDGELGGKGLREKTRGQEEAKDRRNFRGRGDSLGASPGAAVVFETDRCDFK